MSPQSKRINKSHLFPVGPIPSCSCLSLLLRLLFFLISFYSFSSFVLAINRESKHQPQSLLSFYLPLADRSNPCTDILYKYIYLRTTQETVEEQYAAAIITMPESTIAVHRWSETVEKEKEEFETFCVYFTRETRPTTRQRIVWGMCVLPASLGRSCSGEAKDTRPQILVE